MGCNLRCKHCGSSCEESLQNELSTEEAIDLCKQLGEMGFKWITISGGEPTTRKDWNIIAKNLSLNGVIPNIITNGWLLTDEMIDKAKEAGINTLAISLDGLEETHDFIRKKGSYSRIINALKIAKDKNLSTSIITTISKYNIHQLPLLKNILIESNVKGWQVQLGLPMGNFSNLTDKILEPKHIEEIIDFCYETMLEGKISIQPADCIGYNHVKEIEIKQVLTNNENYNWNGCNAGVHSIGILHNGDIVGCTSIRNKEFVAGNIRNNSLKDIWDNTSNFEWNICLDKSKLSGFCKICIHGNQCKGGCANTRLTMENNINGENNYCAYNYSFKAAKNAISNINDTDNLLTKANKFIKNEDYQLAELVLSRLIELSPQCVDAYKLHGYVSYMMENYQEAYNSNLFALEILPNDPYLLKGIGLSLVKLKNITEGISYLYKSLDYTDSSFMDPFYDLAIVLIENNQIEDAKKVIESGKSISEEFATTSKVFDKYFE